MSPPSSASEARSAQRLAARPWWRRLGHLLTRTWRSAVHLEDTPHRIALGCACGLGPAYLPILGQMLLGMALARVLRGNVIASMPWTWITNPFTTVPLLYASYRLGLTLTPGTWPRLSFARLRALIDEASSKGWRDGIGSIYAVLRDVYLPMLVGAAVLGLASALLGYFIIRALVRRLQARRERRRAGWQVHLSGRLPPR